MVSVYDPNLRLTEQGTNDNPNTWGSILNTQVIALISEAIAGVATIDCTGTSDIDISTTTVNGGTDTARHAVLELTGLIGNDINLIVPALEKIYIIRAAQTGGFVIRVKPVGGSTSVPFATGTSGALYTNGTNIFEVGATSGTGLLAANNLSDLLSVSAARANLGLNSAALLTAGTAPNNAVQLTAAGKLPAVDGSLLTNVSGTPPGLGTAAYLNAGTAAGNLVQLNGSAQLPAVDGSLLTGINIPNIPAVTSSKLVFGPVTVQIGRFDTTPAAGNLPAIVFPTAFSGTPTFITGSTTETSLPYFVAFPKGTWSSSGVTPKAYSSSTGNSVTCSYCWLAVGPT